jgi:hypothetical protein
MSEERPDPWLRLVGLGRPVYAGRRARPLPVGGTRSTRPGLIDWIDDSDATVPPSALLLLQGSPNWYPRICARLERTRTEERPFVVVWHSEPLPSPRVSRLPSQRLHLRELAKIALRDPRATDPYTNLTRLERLARHGLPDLLAVSTRERQVTLEERGIDAELVPLGYYPALGRDLGLERDLDVLFLGALDVPRRKRALRRLRRLGVELVEKGDWSDASLFGEPRVELLNRTKILLNLARQPGQLSGLRMILGMANGALVVSEPIWLADPYVPGQHFVQAPLDELPDLIRYYLEHEDERLTITERARRFVTTELNRAAGLDRLVTLIENRLRSSHS